MTQQPIVGIAAVISVQHDFHVVVDVVGVLHRFTSAHEFRLAVGIPTFESGDCGFGDHQAAGIFAEIIVAHDYAWIAIHDHVEPLGRGDIENYSPALALQIAGPIIVGHYDLAVGGPA